MFRASTIVILALALVAGCGKRKEEPATAEPETPPTAAKPTEGAQPPAEEAQTMFKTVCAACHGETGTGNGPAAAALDPKPRNYTDKTWQASVTDDQIAKTILMGGAAVGKSPVMPAQPQLREKPEVLAELVKIIRKFGQ
jgi:cytochrome c553